jgi:hypothetical protein
MIYDVGVKKLAKRLAIRWCNQLTRKTILQAKLKFFHFPADS